MKKLITLILFAISLNSIGQIEYNGKYNLLLYRGSHRVTSLNDYYNYNDSAIVLFSRLPTKPSVYEKLAISRWYDSIQVYNIDDTLEHRFFYASGIEGNSVIDWFSALTTTYGGTPEFEPYYGFKFNGTSSYLKLNYNPINSTKFKLNSGSISFHINTNYIYASKWPIGIRDATNGIGLKLDATNETYYHNRLSAGAVFAHGSNMTGYRTISRLNNSVYLKKNGGGYVSQSYSYTGIPNQTNGLYLGAINNQGTAANFDSNQFSLINIGAHLDANQANALYKADSTLLDFYQNPLIVIVGQSNAAGRGYKDSLSATLKAIIPNCAIILNDTFGLKNFTTLQAGYGTSDWGLRFGLEISLGYNLAQKYDTVYFAKCAHGGSPIRYFMEGGQYHNEMLNTINRAISLSGKQSIMFIFYEGENDWFEESTTFYDDLTTFFSQLTPKVNGVILKKILIELRYDTKAAFTNVLDNEIEYCTDNSLVFFQSIIGLGYLDHTHLNTQGYVDLGEEIFNRNYKEVYP